MEAVEVLAREAGMTDARPRSRRPPNAPTAGRCLQQVMDEAVKFYRLQLKTAAGSAARSLPCPRNAA
jgi:DNA primase